MAWLGTWAAENAFCAVAAALVAAGSVGAAVAFRTDLCCAWPRGRAAAPSGASPAGSLGGSTHASTGSLWERDTHAVSWERLTSGSSFPPSRPPSPRGAHEQLYF